MKRHLPILRSSFAADCLLLIAFLTLVRAAPSQEQADQRPTSGKIERLWGDLAGADAVRAYQR